MARQQTVVVIISGVASGPTTTPLESESMNDPDAHITVIVKSGSYSQTQAEGAANAARDYLLG